MRKVGNVLFSFVPLLVALVIQITVSVVGAMLYGVILGFKMALKGETDPQIIQDSIVNAMSGDVVMILTGIIALVTAIAFGIWYKTGFKNKIHLPLKNIFSVKKVVWIVLMGIAIQFGTAMFLTILENWKPTWFESYNKLMESMGMGDSWITFLVVVILAPIGEELIFRGVVLQYAKKAMPFFVANILQALMFGIYHLNVVQGAYAFVSGMFFGLVCYRLQSVYASMLAHMVVNLTGICLSAFGGDTLLSDMRVLITILLASILVLVATTAAVNKDRADKGQNLIVEETV